MIVSRRASLEGLEDYVLHGGKAIFVEQHSGFAVPQSVRVDQLDGAALLARSQQTQLPTMPAVENLHAGRAGLIAIPQELIEKDRTLVAAKNCEHGSARHLTIALL